MTSSTFFFLACWSAAGVLYSDDVGSSEANPDVIQTQGYVVYFDVQGPLSYATATQRPEGALSTGTVFGQACQHALSIPFTGNLSSASGRIDGGFGRGGFIQALRAIRKKSPEIVGLYNVQVDAHETSILSIYTRRCVEVTGVGYTVPVSSQTVASVRQKRITT